MRTTKLARVVLVAKDAHAVDASLLAREHPTVAIGLGDTTDACDPIVDACAWTEALDFRPFDEAFSRAASDAVCVRGDRDVGRIACEVLTRYQRFVYARNAASDCATFDAVLRALRAMHDFDKPLVVADWDHAIDTWQWMLRLDPSASLSAQLAALLHDVERLESEADRRVEHLAPDYQAFKDAHARRGADRAAALLARSGVEAAAALRAADIVASHERRGRDAEIDLLNDADGLSFFSLNSPGYADYYGPEQTRRKIAYTLGRMSASARERLSLVRLRRDVAAALREVAP